MLGGEPGAWCRGGRKGFVSSNHQQHLSWKMAKVPEYFFGSRRQLSKLSTCLVTDEVEGRNKLLKLCGLSDEVFIPVLLAKVWIFIAGRPEDNQARLLEMTGSTREEGKKKALLHGGCRRVTNQSEPRGNRHSCVIILLLDRSRVSKHRIEASGVTGECSIGREKLTSYRV